METPMNSSTLMTDSSAGAGSVNGNEAKEQSTVAVNSDVSMTGKGQNLYESASPIKNQELKTAPANIDTQIPSKSASSEEWANFYNQLGRPQTAQEYELPVPEGDSGEFAKDIAPLLHEVGLSKTQAQDLAKGGNGYVDKLQQQHQAQQEQEQLARHERNRHEAESLRHEWQGRYDANLEQARRARQQFLPSEQADDIINAIEQTIGVKATLQMLHSIGKGLAEDDAAGLQRQQSMPYKNAAEVLFDKR